MAISERTVEKMMSALQRVLDDGMFDDNGDFVLRSTTPAGHIGMGFMVAPDRLIPIVLADLHEVLREARAPYLNGDTSIRWRIRNKCQHDLKWAAGDGWSFDTEQCDVFVHKPENAILPENGQWERYMVPAVTLARTVFDDKLDGIKRELVVAGIRRLPAPHPSGL